MNALPDRRAVARRAAYDVIAEDSPTPPTMARMMWLADAVTEAVLDAAAPEAERFPVQPCEECETRIQQAVHDLHTEVHPDGGRGCAQCRQTVLIVAEALNYREDHVLPPASAPEAGVPDRDRQGDLT